jgi:hypothetical protein
MYFASDLITFVSNCFKPSALITLATIGAVRVLPKALNTLPTSPQPSSTEVAASNVGDVYRFPVEAFANGDPWTCAIRDNRTCIIWYHQTTKEFYSCTANAGDTLATCTLVQKPW